MHDGGQFVVGQPGNHALGGPVGAVEPSWQGRGVEELVQLRPDAAVKCGVVGIHRHVCHEIAYLVCDGRPARCITYLVRADTVQVGELEVVPPTRRFDEGVQLVGDDPVHNADQGYLAGRHTAQSVRGLEVHRDEGRLGQLAVRWNQQGARCGTTCHDRKTTMDGMGAPCREPVRFRHGALKVRLLKVS